jgi:FkbM family methyltransferase
MSGNNNLLDKFRSIFKFPLLEKLILWFTIDQIYSKWHKLFIPNHYQYKKGSERLCERNGVNFKLDISDLMEWYVYFGFREKGKGVFYSTIKKGDIILDIGANLGQITLISAIKTGKKGKVISIEPDADNFKKLKSNIELNPFDNIETFFVALSDKSGRGEIIIRDDSNHGMNRIHVNENTGDIPISTLDELLLPSANKITHIKIDTEGYEFKILKGGINLIKKCRPFLYIEIIDSNLKHQNDTPHDIFNLLHELNYSLYQADSGSQLFPAMDFSECQLDIIAIPK